MEGEIQHPLEDVDEAGILMSNDGELITRGEFRRYNSLMVRRLQRIENLCFEDSEDQLSLKTFITTMNEHRKVLCSWAKWIIRGGAVAGGLAAIGGLLILVIEHL